MKGGACNNLATKVQKAVPVHTIKPYGGNRGIAPFVLNLDSRLRRVVSFVSQFLYPGYPLNEMLKYPRGRYGRSGERENALSLPGIET
jgi:hypothetical protein